MLEINGREYISVPVAAEIIGYSETYVAQLAKGKWVDASFIQNQYYVNIDSLVRFIGLLEESNQDVLTEQAEREQVAAAFSSPQQPTDDSWVILGKSGLVVVSGLLVGILSWATLEAGLEATDILAGAAEVVGLMATVIEPMADILSNFSFD